jgi:putative chitinase
VHVVQRGENLFRIALRYNTTVEAIAAANNIRNPQLIYVGQRLTIPRGGGTTPSPGGGRTHVVRPGENLFRIALRYGTTAQAIAAANNLPNIHLIYVGQVLRIP